METLVLCLIITGIILLKRMISKIKFFKKRKKVNKLLEQKVAAENFKATKTLYVSDWRTTNSPNEQKQQILVDSKNKKLLLTDYVKQKFYVLNFSDVIGCEIFETSSISGKRKNMDNWCNSLKLIIKIKDMDLPQVAYEIVSKRKVDKESHLYEALRNSTQEIKSFFDVINSEAAPKSKKFVYCMYCGAKNHAESLKCESCGGDLK